MVDHRDDDYETPRREQGETSAPRARNRTVMLTPEITGQVRAKLAQELSEGEASGARQSFDASRRRSLTPRNFSPPQASEIDQGGEREEQLYQDNPPVASRAVSRAMPTPVKQQEPIGGDQVIWSKDGPLVGFLVSFDRNPNGDSFELRAGRLIVSSEMGAPGSYLILESESVSSMHAIMRISSNGEIQVLDQLSEFGTRIKLCGSDEEIELSGDKSTIEHGDIVQFGDRTLFVCLLTLAGEA